MKMTYDELVAKLVANLARIPYTELASVYNDILSMDGAEGTVVEVVYSDDADEPEFVECANDDSEGTFRKLTQEELENRPVHCLQCKVPIPKNCPHKGK